MTIGEMLHAVRDWLHNFWRLPLKMDYTFITDRLAVGGGIATQADVEALKAAGVTHIIDMRMEFNDGPVLLSNHWDLQHYLYLPQVDNGTPRDPKQYIDGIEFALCALSALENRVYCHCAAGMNRGPLMGYAIMRAFGLTERAAVAMIRLKRPVVTFYTIQNYMNSVNSLFPKDTCCEQPK